MSTTLDSFLKNLLRKSKAAAELPDLKERFQFVIAEQPLNLPRDIFDRVDFLIKKLTGLVQSPEFQASLANQPHANDPVALFEPGNSSVLMAYDFHVNTDGSGLKLIEVNTNASGFLIAENLLESLGLGGEACVERLFLSFAREYASFHKLKDPSSFQEAQLLLRGKRLAIVDEKIFEQKMYVEFLLFREMFQNFGLLCELVEISDLVPEKFDLIYNRLTDFYFENPVSAKLREAYLNKAVMVSPNPRQYFLLADKNRLIELSNRGLDPAILKTEKLSNASAELIWTDRKKYFFKPATMYGGRGAYRGGSLSRKVFERLLTEDYLIQEYSQPGQSGDQKFDLRFYAYRDEVHLVIARLYSGQVTGFQALGNGFAPVTFNAHP